MIDCYIGQIIIFAGDYAPDGWAFCDGRLMEINEHEELFLIIGNKYGGDGRTTFALPDLRGRVPIHFGQGSKLTENYKQGALGGVEKVTLEIQQIPNHTHVIGSKKIKVSPDNATVFKPIDGVSLAVTGVPESRDGFTAFASYNMSTPSVELNSESLDLTIEDSGGDEGHTNMQPYLVMNYIIALEGDYPPHGGSKKIV